MVHKEGADGINVERRSKTGHSQKHSSRMMTMGIRAAIVLVLVILGPSLPNVKSDDTGYYMYDEDGGVVIDYMPSLDDPGRRRPEFLYNPISGPRFIEFYAPWCPHCQNFRDHFVEFAGELDYMAKLYGEPNLKIHAISCQAHIALCRDWKIKVYPQLRMIRANETIPTGNITYEDLNTRIALTGLGIEKTGKPIKVNKRLGSPDGRQGTRDANEERQAREEAAIKEALAYRRTKDDISNDAYLSFQFALRNGIFMTNDALTGEARDFFRAWIQLLYRTVPPTSRIHALAKAIRQDFDSAIQGEEHMERILGGFPPLTQKWSLACTKGKKAAGYTCGLWELFHMVTVGVVEWNELALENKEQSKVIGVEDAAVTIRNYIGEFLGCEVCRIHFLKAFDACAHNRCERLQNNATTLTEWKQLPLWLFDTHNAVNVRLMNERAEREDLEPPTVEDELAVLWPHKEQCPACWRLSGGWMEHDVANQLKKDYWPTNTTFFIAEQQELFENIDKVDVFDEVKEYEGDDAEGAAEKEEENLNGETTQSVERDLFEDVQDRIPKDINTEMGVEGNSIDVPEDTAAKEDATENVPADTAQQAPQGEHLVPTHEHHPHPTKEHHRQHKTTVTEVPQLAFYLVPVVSVVILAAWALSSRRKQKGFGKKTH